MKKTGLLIVTLLFCQLAIAQQQCQLIVPILDNVSVTPTIETDPSTGEDVAYYDICQGETISFTAHGEYPESGQDYVQSDATSTFSWDFNSLAIEQGTTVDYTFMTGGGYIVTLTIEDVQGCTNTEILKLYVRVSTTPTINLNASPTTVCPGQESDIEAEVIFEPTNWNADYENSFSEELFIPDGPNCPPGFYQTGITFDNFLPAQTLNNVTDFLNVCVEMEHTFMGDLTINLIAPDGSTVVLLQDQNAAGVGNGLGGADLGEPDFESTGGACDPDANPPGVGYVYCWSPTPSTDNWHELDALGTLGNPVNASVLGTFTNIYPAYDDLVTGINTFENIVGVPLNGTWQIEVIDTWGADNGWIFQWWIDFNPNILPSEWGFTPQIIDNGWVTASTTVSIDGDVMTIDPAEPGSYDYSYEVVDNFGCAYEDQISVEVTSFIELGSSETENDYCGQSIGTAEIQGAGGTPQYSYYWPSLEENTASVEDLQFGLYNYIITDQLGCTYEGTIEVGNDVAELLLEVTSFENDACNQGVGQININPLTGLGPYTYDWNHPSASGNPATNLNQGLYSVDVSDIGGCVGTITQFIDNIEGPNSSFYQDADTVIYVSGNVNFNDLSLAAQETNIASWFWSFGDGDFSTSQNPSHDFNQIGEYLVELTVTDANGCEDIYASEVVAVEDYFIWAPNAFSPNGDIHNEIFRPIIQNFIPSSFDIYIYDRWGKLVYQSDDYYSGWDGIRMNNGIAADTDSYSYVVKFNTHRNVLIEYTGVVLIIR